MVKRFIILLLLLSKVSIAQYEPPKLDFIGLTDKWHYISVDDNFIKNPIDEVSTPYWGRFSTRIMENGSCVLILEPTVTQNPYAGLDGFILHKIDLNTGEVIWKLHQNIYTGELYRQKFVSMYINQEGNIVILGYRDIDKRNKKFPKITFYGLPFKKVVDINTGKIIDYTVSTDITSRKETSSQGNYIYVDRFDNFVNFHTLTYIGNDTLKNKAVFNLYDDDMNIILPAVDSVVNNTGIPTHELSLSVSPYFKLLNRDTMLTIFGVLDPATFTIDDVRLHWIDFSDADNLSDVLNISLKNDIYSPQNKNNSNININVKDDNIFMFQGVIPADTTLPPKFIDFVWYDKDGKKLLNISPLHTGDMYEYFDLDILCVVGDKAYVALGYRDEDAGVQGYDIVSIDKNTANVVKTGELFIPNDLSKRFYIMKSMLTTSNDLFLRIKVIKYIENNKRTDFSYYYCFDPKVLGIKTSSVKNVKKEYNARVFPNPSDSDITIEFDDSFSGTVQLIGQTGKLIANKIIKNQKEITFDVSNIPAGMYVIKACAPTGEILYSEKIVKNK